jgi:alpha-mannosidase
MHFALEHQNPLVTGLVAGTTPLYPEKAYSFLRVDDPSVLLWSVKPSEDGIQSGLITRFWNLNATAAKPRITFNNRVRGAWQTSHIETDQQKLSPQNGSLVTEFRQNQIQTFRVTF